MVTLVHCKSPIDCPEVKVNVYGSKTMKSAPSGINLENAVIAQESRLRGAHKLGRGSSLGYITHNLILCSVT